MTEPYKYQRYKFDVALVAPIVGAAEEAAFEYGRSRISLRAATASARLSLWGDAVASCRMEGIESRVDADPTALSPVDFAAMRVSRAGAYALSLGSAPGPRVPTVVRPDTVREIHEIAMTGVGAYDEISNLVPGEFRTGAAVIQARDPTKKVDPDALIVHVGADPDHINKYMQQWSRDYGPGPAHPMVRAGLGHLSFEKIHPFSDGNGRVGRIVASAMLGEAGYPSTTISGVISRRRDLYYAGLRSADGGDATQWLQFFSGAAWDAVSSRGTLDRRVEGEIDRLSDAAGSRSHGTDALLTELVSMPVATVRALTARTGVDPGTAMDLLERLAGDGLVALTPLGEGAIVRVPSVIALAHQQDGRIDHGLAQQVMADYKESRNGGAGRNQGAGEHEKAKEAVRPGKTRGGIRPAGR
mgnify:CR=1 FL=1